MDNLQDLILTVDDDKNIAVIQFNRPAKRNAFSQNTINELVAVLAHLDQLETVRAVVITGQPDGHFCGMFHHDLGGPCHAQWLMFPNSAGMDLNELVQISTAKGHQRAFLKDLTDSFSSFTKPIIAAVVGYAVSVASQPLFRYI